MMEKAMTPRKGKAFQEAVKTAALVDALTDPLKMIHPHAAGIDVHAAVHYVAVPPGSVPHLAPGAAAAGATHAEGELPNVRAFGACTADLEALADWLRQCGVTTIAMESTGVYWIPLFELLEQRGFEVFLVDPRQTRHAPGRPKSDVRDCQWIQRLHSYGLLSASFRPTDQVVVLRGYLRQRQLLIGHASQHVQHMQKALELMNVKLPEVVNDITGVTGMAIIKAILRGERDPLELAKYRNDRCHRAEAEMARALYGNWRAEHLFALKQAVALYEFCRAQLTECDQELEKHLQTFTDLSRGETLTPKSKSRKRKPNSNEPNFDARNLLLRMSGVDLTVIEGIEESTALTILSEIGRDMSKFRTEKQFCSWLSLCPNHQGSAGKIRSRRIRRGSNRAARALRLAAQACHHAKNAMGAFYRRIQARCGGQKAVIATAHKLAARVYRLLKYGKEYVRQEMHAYEENYRLRQVKGLARKAAELGYQLLPVTPAQEVELIPASP
jgi:transposase